MKHISLDHADDRIKEFIRSLPIDGEGVELELGGQVVCQVLPPLEESEKAALIERGRQLVARSRARNKGVPSKAIEREVREAVDRVRRRKAE